MRIAAHHISGTAEHKLSGMLTGNVEYQPKCRWPDDCMVQWGHGIIPANPFFEAFPRGTFIRGDGGTIEEAEERAFAQYERDQSCSHQWGRQRPGKSGSLYTNGAGWCRKCGGFRGQMFKPVVELGSHRRPLSRTEKDYLKSLETDDQMNEIMDRKYPEMRATRQKSRRLLRIRMNLFGVRDPTL